MVEKLTTPGDVRLARLAARQHGHVSTKQLRALGLSDQAIEKRVRRGRLHRRHRGVYAVGHALFTSRGRIWAAVLATGGVVSHRVAAALWALLPWPSGPVDITTLGAGRSMPGIRVHRSRTLDPQRDVTTHEGIPVTTVARTLIDLVDAVKPRQLEQALHKAEILELLDVRKLTPPPGRRARSLRAALATLQHDEPLWTDEGAAAAFLELVLNSDLPRPRTEVPLLKYRADFFWPEQRLVVEVDGRSAHLRPSAFEKDRRRDADLQLAGYRVVRFTWRQIAYEPDYVLSRLRALLARPRP